VIRHAAEHHPFVEVPPRHIDLLVAHIQIKFPRTLRAGPTRRRAGRVPGGPEPLRGWPHSLLRLSHAPHHGQRRGPPPEVPEALRRRLAGPPNSALRGGSLRA